MQMLSSLRTKKLARACVKCLVFDDKDKSYKLAGTKEQSCFSGRLGGYFNANCWRVQVLPHVCARLGRHADLPLHLGDWFGKIFPEGRREQR